MLLRLMHSTHWSLSGKNVSAQALGAGTLDNIKELERVNFLTLFLQVAILIIIKIN